MTAYNNNEYVTIVAFLCELYCYRKCRK